MFDDLIAQHRARLRQFLDQPQSRALFLRVDSDVELLIARILADVGADQEHPTLALGFSGDLADPEQFYPAAAEDVAPFLGELAEALSTEDQEVVFPTGMEAGREGLPVEVRFAAFLEGIARGGAGLYDHTLFVFRFDEVGDAKRAALSLGWLVGAISFPGVKIIVVDDRARPRFVPFTVPVTPRYAVDRQLLVVNDAVYAVRSLAHQRGERVLGVTASAARGRALRETFALPPGPVPGASVFFVGAEVRTRGRFLNGAYEQLLTRVPEPERAKLPRDIWDLRAMEAPEATFTELVERLLPWLAADGQILVLALAPEGFYAAAAWQALVAALPAAAVSTRVRYLLLDIDQAAPLPPAAPVEVRWEVDEMTLHVAAAEGDLRKLLAKPDLPMPERVQLSMALGSLLATRKELDEGLRLISDAIASSEEIERPDLQMLTWCSMGDALSRGDQNAMARNAYAEGASLALDAGNDPVAARALIGIGNTHFLAGEYADAIGAYSTSYTYAERAGNLFGACQAKSWVAESMRQLGDHARADAVLKEVVALYETLGDPFRDIAREGLAETYQRLSALHKVWGRRADATAWANKARALGRQWPASERPS